ncbi:short-chain dehydrogenase/reductase-like protein SDR [Dendryphion nanum]|uniref:Short-chain dehydrogenase/reductase-like protein SDR n=1 Tax=Dendryphion nanum TaxID=256645 RepID=A0A9P9EBY7_9PLEO|nr:short-chain dehydrogenase/reductase-like protein SDR [Dendryphion nanum]
MAGQRVMNVLITGGARGIGRGLVRHFAEKGNKVIFLDSNAAELAHTEELLRNGPNKARGEVKGLTCDLSNREVIKEKMKLVEQEFQGKLDVLVNNAFPTPHIWSDDKAMDDSNETIMEEWDTKIAVGLTAPFLLSRLCVPLLKAGGSGSSPGCIVNISSTRAYQSELNHEAYSAAKAGLLGLTQSMAVSLGHSHKIRVNAIIPGWINVENENSEADKQGTKWDDGLTDQDMEWHPAGRVGKVQDIIQAVQYVVGAEFITGQEIVVDGGVGRKMVYPE